MRLLPYLLLPLLLACALPSLAQNGQRQTQNIDFSRGQANIQFQGEVPYWHQSPFFAYFIEWAGGPLPLDIRFSEDGQNWTNWEPLLQDSHNDEKGITTLHFGDPDYHYYELKIDSRAAQTEVAILHFYQPGDTPTDTPTANTGTQSTSTCPCPQPEVLIRNQWCPSGNCPEHPNPSPTDVTHLIVHHSAGVNVSTDWSAVVRAVWDFHVNGNGWSDVGYNFLIDPNGVIYEGRGDNVVGAHFCGTNTNTLGTCMLGTYSTVAPSEEAIASLERLLAWKACDIGADPQGESFHAASNRVLKHISGHRDGCSTECPGNAFYPLFDNLRQGVQNQILANCSGLSSPISLSATEVTEDSYFLAWSHNSPDEEGFLLERSLDNGATYELRADLEANTLSFFEEDLELIQLYLYRIRAYTETDTSEYSNIVTINTGVVSTEDHRLPVTALRLSPNPAKEVLQLELQTTDRGVLQLQLLDLQQRPVLQQILSKQQDNWQHSIELGGFPAGTYLLRIQLDQRQGVWKIVKQ